MVYDFFFFFKQSTGTRDGHHQQTAWTATSFTHSKRRDHHTPCVRSQWQSIPRWTWDWWGCCVCRVPHVPGDVPQWHSYSARRWLPRQKFIWCESGCDICAVPFMPGYVSWWDYHWTCQSLFSLTLAFSLLWVGTKGVGWWWWEQRGPTSFPTQKTF